LLTLKHSGQKCRQQAQYLPMQMLAVIDSLDLTVCSTRATTEACPARLSRVEAFMGRRVISRF